MPNVLPVLAGGYTAITLVLLGAFVFDETQYRNPRYRVAIAFAIGWPAVLGFALLKRIADGGSR